MEYVLMRFVMIVRFVRKWSWLISLWHSWICLYKNTKSKNRCPNSGLRDVKAVAHHIQLGDLQVWVSHFLGGLYRQPAHNHEPFGWGASTICGEEGCGGGIIVTWYKTREGRVDGNRDNGRREDNRVYVGARETEENHSNSELKSVLSSWREFYSNDPRLLQERNILWQRDVGHGRLSDESQCRQL
jgi:hypothetical protein